MQRENTMKQTYINRVIQRVREANRCLPFKVYQGYQLDIASLLDEVAQQQKQQAALVAALDGLHRAVSEAYLGGHITDAGFPTFRMDEASKALADAKCSPVI